MTKADTMDPITDEEAFEYCLKNFLEWLHVLTLEPIDLCNSWGNYNVAWELTHDLKSDGDAVIALSCSYLSDAQKQEVRNFLSSLSSIPESLLVSATTVEANQEAMKHPCWVPFRKSALSLSQILESAAVKNRHYFAAL